MKSGIFTAVFRLIRPVFSLSHGCDDLHQATFLCKKNYFLQIFLHINFQIMRIEKHFYSSSPLPKIIQQSGMCVVMRNDYDVAKLEKQKREMKKI